MISQLVHNLLVILIAGLLAGFVCKRLQLSMLIGYLLAGAIIGHGGLGLVGEEMKEIEHLARAGALLLLFAIGIEFSLEELARLGRFFFVGGTAQMLLVAAPIWLMCVLLGISWKSALLIAAATALSSTVLVYRALTEWGETASSQGRRAIGVLLFQDAALVPLMLLVPLLVGNKQDLGALAYLLLALNSLLFVAAIPLLRRVLARWAAPLLSDLQSVELVILFALIILIGFCLGAYVAGLPPALGAFAAGLVMNGNRLTGQVDALILPYRETFGVVFFVSLGTLFDVRVFMDSPVLLCAGLFAVLVLKSGAAAVALRLTRLPWHAALGMGMGLAQLGELSFVLLAEGQHAGLISDLDYSRMLFVAMGTLLLTPMLLKYGLQWSRRGPQVPQMAKEGLVTPPPPGTRGGNCYRPWAHGPAGCLSIGNHGYRRLPNRFEPCESPCVCPAGLSYSIRRWERSGRAPTRRRSTCAACHRLCPQRSQCTADRDGAMPIEPKVCRRREVPVSVKQRRVEECRRKRCGD